MGGVVVVNLFAYRSASLRALRAVVAEENNDDTTLDAVGPANRWGQTGASARGTDVSAMAPSIGQRPSLTISLLDHSLGSADLRRHCASSVSNPRWNPSEGDHHKNRKCGHPHDDSAEFRSAVNCERHIRSSSMLISRNRRFSPSSVATGSAQDLGAASRMASVEKQKISIKP
jgi:hypothetical protein